MKNTLLVFSLLFYTLAYTQVDKSNVTGGSASTGQITQIVSFSSNDFGSGITVSDVNVTITWEGEDATNTFFNEVIEVTLTSPSGSTVQLVKPRGGGSNDPTYGYNAGALSTWGTVTTTFDDHASSTAFGTDHPMNGSWKPQNPLSDFIGESPIGNWALSFSYINFLGTDVLNWSGFTIGIAGGLMPVELTKFQVKEMTNSHVQIDWQTASEQDNDYFLLERSSDTKTWKSINKTKGAGTSFDRIDYQFIDQEIRKGTVYYRLKQVDFDGTYEYSEIIPVDLKEEKSDQFEVFPNPADQLITLKNAKGKITIYNTLNQIIYSFNNEEYNYKLDLINLPKGQYIIQVQGKNKIKKQRLIKL